MGMQFRSSRVPDVGIFVAMDEWKSAAKRKHKLIDLSVGASDLSPPVEALDTLRAATHDPSTYGYCLKEGTMELLTAACDWYAKRYGIQLDPNTEALSLIGSQEGLAHLLFGITEHGDRVLMCDVAYPSYWGALKIAGLTPSFLPIDPATGLPDFSRIKTSELERVKAVLLNYPNNPTAVTATEAFFEHAIKFCQSHGLLLIHDNPYVDQVYEGKAPSPLALPGGRECCVEFFSFSKSHHLGGFRIGWALGVSSAITSLAQVKAPIDFNQYKGIQLMGVTCLNLPEERVRADAQVWRRRAATMVEALEKHAGWRIRMPTSGMYLWSQLPARQHDPGQNAAAQDHSTLLYGGDDARFCQELLSSTGVALTPGSAFGPGGRSYVRIVLIANEAKLVEAAQKIGQWLMTKNLADPVSVAMPACS